MTLVDWAIVVIAIFVVLQAIMWIVLLWVLVSLMRKLNREVGPILESGKVTAANVRATSFIISETVVHPFIRLAAFVSGVRRAMAVLAGFTRRGRAS